MLRIRSPTKDQIIAQLTQQSTNRSHISTRSVSFFLFVVFTLYLVVTIGQRLLQAHLDQRQIGVGIGENSREGHDWDPIYAASSGNGSVDPVRQWKVRSAIKYAWDAYVENCWGRDHIHPVSGSCSDMLGMGVTIVDAMDTLKIVGLDNEYEKARNWVVEEMSLETSSSISVFETIIRVLGGMLSAYELTGEKDKALLLKAKVLGEKLLTAFESRSGLPYTRINLRSGSVTFHDWGDWYHNKACLAELASLELEFAVLSYHTNDERFLRTALNVIQVIKDAKKPIPGLYPSYMEIKYGTFFDNTYSVGSMADSFYEYLLKMWVLSHKTAFAFKSMYLVSARAILENLLQRSPSGLLYIGKMDGATENVEEEMEHLTCFFPGVLALGSYFRVSDDNRENLEHLKVAEDLAWSCYSMYSQQVTKLSADKTSFKEKKLKSVIPSFALRPETIESLFILHRITGKQNYREMAWDIFQAIEANCLHERGFAPLSDVSRESQSDGPMETFLIAETFKYLYLIFSDTDSISLDEFVFNTEAHPLKIRRDILSVLSKTKFI